jgi:aminoglycoside phosphotransferase (APT) family kinase protein
MTATGRSRMYAPRKSVSGACASRARVRLSEMRCPHHHDGTELLRALVQHIVERRFNGINIDSIQRSPASEVGSYLCQVVSVHFTTGERFELFLKDLCASQLPKDGLSERRARERYVYDQWIADTELGTAEYYGSVWDESNGRFWLLLEFVKGARLDRQDLNSWMAAATWLGRMQAHFARLADFSYCGSHLLRHDGDFFWAKAERARRAVSQLTPEMLDRFNAVLSEYQPLVDLMVSQPRTLVHGSYRPENILVERRSAGLRICPVDWELAGIGAPLYDLSFITDGADPETLERLNTAYCQAAATADIPLPGKEAMDRVMTCFRLHKVMKSLGDSPTWQSPETRIAKLVQRAERYSCIAHSGSHYA